MAARKRKVTLTETWKDGIRVSLLMGRLYDHALGDAEMSQTQIKAAQVVLGKLLPDLNKTTLEGDEDNPLHHAITLEVKGVSAHIG
jgi:hypothetical protein